MSKYCNLMGLKGLMVGIANPAYDGVQIASKRVARLWITYLNDKVKAHTEPLAAKVKAALETTILYMASELSLKNIRINAISPGPIITSTSSKVPSLDKLIENIKIKSVIKQPATIEDIDSGRFFKFTYGKVYDRKYYIHG